MQIRFYEQSQIHIFWLKKFFDWCTFSHQRPDITWSNYDGDLLLCTWQDLAYHDQIAWQDINIVLAETYSQLKHWLDKFDKNKSYIFVVESHIDSTAFDKEFGHLSVLKYLPIFHELESVFGRFFDIVSPWTWQDDNVLQPQFDFFCFIGRKTLSRQRFIDSLLHLDLSKSLVKYHSDTVSNSALANFDQIGYKVDAGYYYDKLQLGKDMFVPPTKYAQPELYQNFKFEVVHETDSAIYPQLPVPPLPDKTYIEYESQSPWPLVEYHLTEKTLKPLIAGKPALIYAAPGYNQWLATMGIDIGYQMFDLSFDDISDDHSRMQAIMNEIYKAQQKTFGAFYSIQHAKNLSGLKHIRDINVKSAKSLYQLVHSVAGTRQKKRWPANSADRTKLV